MFSLFPPLLFSGEQMSSAMCVCMCCCFPWKRGKNKRNESNPNEASVQPLIMKLFGEGGNESSTHMQPFSFLY